MPKSAENMNITMGYSIENTLSLELLLQLFDIQINKKRFDNKSNKSSIYHKDLFALLENPIVIKYLQIINTDANQLVTFLTKNNFAFIGVSNIKETLNSAPEILELLFNKEHNNISLLIQNLIKFFTQVKSKLLEADFERIEIEAIHILINNLKQVDQYNKDYPFIETIEGLKKLLLIVLKSEKLSFYGEPLQGMQIMGLLESRVIDFENIILVSCNEKFLPGPHIQNSFIPQDLKEYLGLPTKHDRESIFAYYFYRLLQRTKNVHLIYNNGLPNGLDSNEISRYLIQLKNEFPYPIKVEHIDFSWNNNKKVTTIPKEKETLQKIDLLFEKGLSPSALNNYLRCPLDFYYKYVLRVKEKDELEELIENNTQGDIIHQVLEDLYREQMPNITASKVDIMLDKYVEYTDQQFQKKFPSGSYKFGKNLLYFKMALHSIKLFLNKEKRFIEKEGPFEILSLEELLQTELIVATKQGNKKIVLKGKADRIDVHKGQLRIIDYKSGYTKKEEVTVNSIEEITKSYKATQLMFYAYLYKKQHPDTSPISGIISMKNLNANLLPFTLKSDDNAIQFSDSTYQEFEELLIEIIQEIYDSELIFSHDKESKYCMMCE